MEKVEQAHSVTISTAANGYIAQIGCKRFVFENLAVMLAKLEDYLTEPGKMTEQWAPGESPTREVGCIPMDAAQYAPRGAMYSPGVGALLGATPGAGALLGATPIS
jgi:hypothetical protein